jgi:hypothetical protein
MDPSEQYMSSCTVNLDHEQLLILEGKRGTRIKVIYGGVWLTANGDPTDYFPRSGDEVAVDARRRSIVEAIGRARVEVIEPSSDGLLRRLADGLRKLLRVPRFLLRA